MHRMPCAVRLFPVVLFLLLGAGVGLAAPASQRVFEECHRGVVLVIVLSEQGRVLGHGSGFVADARGHIVTNFHVVKGAHSVEVMALVGEGREKVGGVAVVARDSLNDVALLSVPEAFARKLKPLKLALDYRVSGGETVYAIGNPGAGEVVLTHTITEGIVASPERELPASRGRGELCPVIQHSASINPGNSGGPLLNRNGEVVGINTYKIRDGEQLNFAVPIRQGEPALLLRRFALPKTTDLAAELRDFSVALPTRPALGELAEKPDWRGCVPIAVAAIGVRFARCVFAADAGFMVGLPVPRATEMAPPSARGAAPRGRPAEPTAADSGGGLWCVDIQAQTAEELPIRAVVDVVYHPARSRFAVLADGGRSLVEFAPGSTANRQSVRLERECRRLWPVGGKGYWAQAANDIVYLDPEKGDFRVLIRDCQVRNLAALEGDGGVLALVAGRGQRLVRYAKSEGAWLDVDRAELPPATSSDAELLVAAGKLAWVAPCLFFALNLQEPYVTSREPLQAISADGRLGLSGGHIVVPATDEVLFALPDLQLSAYPGLPGPNRGTWFAGAFTPNRDGICVYHNGNGMLATFQFSRGDVVAPPAAAGSGPAVREPQVALPKLETSVRLE